MVVNWKLNGRKHAIPLDILEQNVKEKLRLMDKKGNRLTKYRRRCIERKNKKKKNGADKN